MASPPTRLPPRPVVVDFDGTLTPVDTLHELMTLTLLRKPITFLRCLRQLRAGRAQFKHALAGTLADYPSVLPWNAAVLSALTREQGPLILCTASSETLARRAVTPLDLFHEIIGSSDHHNLRGENKARHLLERFGSRGFDYYGNDFTDLRVWAHAGRAIVVSHNPDLIARARTCGAAVEVIPTGRPSPTLALLRVLRPHQWIKNLLVFTPLLASHRVSEAGLWQASLLAFGMACLLSSAVYVFNDLHDLASDRVHATKRRRPFASGDVSTLAALPLGFTLLAGGATLALLVSSQLLLAGATYLVLALIYTLWVKRVVLLDVVVLAALFTLRIFAGAAATGIMPSGWLLSFSLGIFLSLALCKRYIELTRLRVTGAVQPVGRGYFLHHAAGVFRLGIALMMSAGAVLALYIQRPQVTELYRRPELLWVAVGAVSIFGIHIWRQAWRERMHDDPVMFALRDPLSWLCLLAVVGTYLAAS